mmetsp:Transcript_31477/g.48288  ORF Transcript_31477/g.48288 Transcript_31477/m.48288 type:complete len:195 (-) Transcript_31477:21-605(-)
MGLAFSTLWQFMVGEQEDTRVLMLGLDAAGKTTILYRLKLGEYVTSIPTIGFNVETIEYHNISLTVWDIGGQDKIRCLWRHYYQGTQGLIFVVDSNDIGRLQLAREELYKVLDTEELRHVPVLIYCNKQDLPDALSPSKISEELSLSKLRLNQCNRWRVQPCCAISGRGLYEGLTWFAKVLHDREKPERRIWGM